ncbi:transglutaminase [Caenimonas koreensis DSM 17982]|uniref:Transglutaminase n=1 Tax=Caenimonas koreensis DSM 17982 TaxID=1121255 RepID=A0A844B6Y3_9BURK|nr:transglutaminase domain-containing protein [Caenimonas koreensis]MRD47419.1 transglutaminase [Caenimonas koreensis DSM 17982]
MKTRRQFIQSSVSLSVSAAAAGFALPGFAQARTFEPKPGDWRTFDVTTRVDLLAPKGVTRVWLPVPSVDSEWQSSLDSRSITNGKIQMTSDGVSGARMVYAEFDANEPAPYVEVTSRVRTRNRATDWRSRTAVNEDADTLAYHTRPTALIPTDGIVLKTALEATRGARTDEEKARAIYDWIVANTYREPKVRGCGEGDIKSMLETGNLGGKCADLNALFVGLCRAVKLPARDFYGLRLAPSAFGYRELGGNSASLKGAQHCRAEVYLQARGWTAMDPADVAKVMRQETPEWIKTTQNSLVAPVNKALFGGWEGNWLAWNSAHDVKLPNSRGPKMGFVMYPIAEGADGRYDSYAPDDFKYQISAREIV